MTLLLIILKKLKLLDLKVMDTAKNGRKKPRREVFMLMKNSLIFTNSWILNKKFSLKLEPALKKKMKQELKFTKATIWEKF